MRGDPFRIERPRLWRAVARLGWSRARRIPFVKQLEIADCGAACLAMVLGRHGRHVALRDLREKLGTGTSGTTATQLIEVARVHGLRGRGVSLDVEAMKFLPPGSILHWGFRHFIVFERIRGSVVEVLDPAVGRRRIPLDQFRRSFTGVALVFERTDDFVPTAAGRGRLLDYYRPLFSQYGLVGRVMLLSGGLRLFALAVPLLTAAVVDRVVPRGDQHLLVIIAAGLGSLLAFQFLSTLVRAHLLLQLRTNLDTKMTIGFVEYLVGLPYAYFQRRTAGDLIARVGSNGVLRQTLTSATMSTSLDGLFAVVYLVLIVFIHAKIAAITLAVGLAQTAVFVAGRHRITQLVRESLEVGARSQNELVQMLAGMETLKLAGVERRAVDRWVELFVDGLNISLRQGRLSAVLSGVGGLIRSAAPVILLSYGAIAVMRGELSLGTMLAVNALAAGFLGPLSALVDVAFSLQELTGHVERIDDVLGETPEQDGKGRRPATLSGLVEVDDVSFRYGEDGPLVLQHIDLRIEPGQTLAIVGRSGCGKSTLASLLLGIHQPTHGRILYDGVDLQELDHAEIRRQVGTVPQHPFIFGRSIRDNIALDVDETALFVVAEAARRACIHEDIAAMPMGYETMVADGGASLSGGQRQRLAIARALVKAPPLLVLDESTSSVDNATEKAIMDNLAELHCARVVIAHRLSTVATADRIVVLEGGRVTETGTHADLMRRRGAYYELVAAQMSELPAGHGVGDAR